MEEKHRELLQQHRSKFVQSVDVERLYPILKGTETSPGALRNEDIQEISQLPSKEEKVEKLLDVLPAAGPQAFQALCLALETTYPHLLTVMFLGTKSPPQTDSRSPSASLASSSSDDVLRNTPDTEDDSSSQDAPYPSSSYRRNGPPSHDYDFNQSNLHLLKQELKLVVQDRDHLKEELQKTQSQLDSYSKMASLGSGDTKNVTDKHLVRDYDWLKTQCDTAMNELQTMKTQLSITMNKCDKAVRESDYYRNEHRISVDKLEGTRIELHAQKQEISELQGEKQRLQQEVIDLQESREENKHEIEELRKQQREVISESGSNEILTRMYDTAIEKYEAIRKDNESLSKRYADLMSTRDIAIHKLESVQEENARLKKQYTDVCNERDRAIKERVALQKQCTDVVRQWDKSLRTVEDLREQLSKTQQQANQSVVRVTKEIARLTEERNAAIEEYRLVMSERGQVHKEMEQLQDKLNEANKKGEVYEKDKKTLRDEIETLRHEITSALHDRDKAIKECNDVRVKYGDIVTAKIEVQKERDEVRRDVEMLTHERNVARKERHEALEQRDRIIRETWKLADEKEYSTKEAEMKKEIEKLKEDVEEVRKEAETAKNRRDWAFSERDKIVLERESMRALCDQLRRERDRLVSELGEALRDSDELKKDKSKKEKELKTIKEHYDAMLDKENRKQQLNAIGHNHSRDSAIDTDLQEWETETLEVDVGGVNDEDFGFELVGGRDDPRFPSDYSIFVGSVTKGSDADGKLKVNDVVLKVNNVDVTNADRLVAVQAIQNGGGILNMVIRRRKCTTKAVQPVHLNISGNKQIGIHPELGMYIGKIVPGTAAARESNLAVGDRLLTVNGRSVDGKSVSDVLSIMESNSDCLSLNVQKFIPVPSSFLPSGCQSNQNLMEGIQATPQTVETTIGSQRFPKFWIDNSSKQNSASNKGSQSGSSECSTPGHTPRKFGKKDENKENIPEKRSSHHENFITLAWDKLVNRSRHKQEKERLSKSGTAITDTSLKTAEEDALTQLNSVLDDIDYKPRVEKRKRVKIEENGGTWPKYRGALEFTSAGTISLVPGEHKKKERPGIPEMLSQQTPNQQQQLQEQQKQQPQQYASPRSAYPKMTQNIPGVSSIGRDTNKSHHFPVKVHSPQNSSDMSAKYGPSFVVEKPPQKPLHSSSQHGHSSKPKYPKATVKHSSVDEISSDGEKRFEPLHYPNTSTPDMDFSVTSGHNNYYPSPRHRPTSAPSNKRGPGHRPPINATYSSPIAKPGSLEVQPMYLPNQQKTYGTQPTSPRDKISPLSNKLQERAAGYHPASYQGMVKSQPVYTPSSTAHHRRTSPNVYGQPQSVGPLFPSTSQPTSPRVTSPPGIHQRPEPLRSYIRHEPYSTSPSPSFSSSTVDRATPTPSEEQFPYGGVSAPKAYHSSGQLEHSDGFSTFPKRGHHHPHHTARIRIPSQDSVNNSVSKIIWSAGSLSDRSSPMSPYLHLEHPGTNSSTGSIPSVEPPRTRKKPEIGETRHISIEKTFQPLGIQIKPGKNGSGIFISSVGQNSLAEHYGLEVGDQILEVCGLSLRTANETQAAIVLRQCGDSMTMLVQYLPDKFEDNGEDSGSSQSSRATSPATSPKLVKHGSNETITSSTPTNSPRNNPNNQSSSSQDSHVPMEPRFVFLQKSAASSLGISLIGGNAVGIFVHEVQKDSVACGPNGLRCGDQILEFNGVDLRSATAEQAAHELSKPSERVTILARYDIVRYNKIRDQPGDSFYIRTLFDRQAENEGELSFKRDDVLYIEDTLYNGMPGTWKAWLVDDEGNKLQCGTIPSKYRMEDELAMKRSLSESLQEEELKNASSRRGSATARRSFFRRKKHQRNNSKDSRELASFSDVSINTDSVPILDDGTVLTYQRVERLDYKVCRPVMILGPLAEPLINKLTSESPDKYCRCESMPMKALAGSVEKALSDGQLVDYRIKDDHYECITVEAVKQIVEKNRHAMLDVSAHAIERLHRLQIYPIVLYCKHKSSKELREVKDTRFLPEKMTSKSAKQLYEQFQKVEQDCRHLFSSMVQGGNSLAYMSTQIKSAIDIEQKKTIWVPSGNI